MKTNVHIARHSELDEYQLEKLWHLYGGQFHCSQSSFRLRAARFTHFAIYQQDGEPTGFTELRIDQVAAAGRRHLLILYGQTILPKGVPSRSLLPRTAIKLIKSHWWQMFRNETWIWYEALSYKAYTAQAKRMDQLYPTCHGPAPQNAQYLENRLGHLRFGKGVCPLTGTVLGKDNILRRSSSLFWDKQLRASNLAFFAEAKAKAVDGFGQLTFTPIDLDNVRRLLTSYLGTLLARAKTWFRSMNMVNVSIAN